MNETTADTGTPANDPGNANADGTAAPEASASAAPATPAPSTQQTDTGKEGEKPTTPEVPESYEFKMPEGVTLDPAAADEFTAIAKELKLSATDAQKVADVGAKMAQRQAEQHANLVEQWAQDVKADKEIGGDNLEQNLALARKAMEAYGSPELKALMDSTGIGNHPAVVRFCIKAGGVVNEDGFVRGSTKTAESDPAKKMFPSMN